MPAELQPGQHGVVKTYKVKSGLRAGKWRTVALYRDWYGGKPTQVSGIARTRDESIARFQQNLKARTKRACVPNSNGVALTMDSRLSDVLDLAMTELGRFGGVTQQTIDDYYAEIDESSDPRATSTMKIRPILGNLRVRECITPTFNDYITEVALKHGREKAHKQRIILGHGMGYAKRVIPDMSPLPNPIDSVVTTRLHEHEREAPRALELDELTRLRLRVRVWAIGGQIGDLPAHVHGPARDWLVPIIGDIMLATGARPGEVLAVRRKEDLKLVTDEDGTVTRLAVTICGTIVHTKEKGWHRQPWPKNRKPRQVWLPSWAVNSVEALLACIEGGHERWSGEQELLLPSPRGLVYNPKNFNTRWRDARGDEFAWVQPMTFRKTVGSAIANEKGPEEAARQLGNTLQVFMSHYWDRPIEVEDHTEILDKLGG